MTERLKRAYTTTHINAVTLILYACSADS